MKLVVIGLILVLILLHWLSPWERERKEIYLYPGIPDEEDLQKEMSLSPKMNVVHSSVIPQVNGRKLEEVYYVIANDPDRSYAFTGFHLADVAVLIKCSGNVWINWTWQEGKQLGEESIILCAGDMRKELDDGFNRIFRATDHPDWKAFVGQAIVDLEYRHRSIHDSLETLSDMKLSFKAGSVSICAIEEPDPADLPSLSSMEDGLWTVIVFDEALLNQQKGDIRLIYMSNSR